MTLKIRQRIKMVNEMPNGQITGGWNDRMGKYLGKVVTIKSFGWSAGSFYIEEDGGFYIWDKKFIAEVLPEKGAIVLKTVSDMKKHFNVCEASKILPVGARIQKVIYDGNKCIVCFVDYKDYTIKTVTKCHECDEFSFQKGMEIAMYNTVRRMADKELKKLCK